MTIVRNEGGKRFYALAAVLGAIYGSLLVSLAMAWDMVDKGFTIWFLVVMGAFVAAAMAILIGMGRTYRVNYVPVVTYKGTVAGTNTTWALTAPVDALDDISLEFETPAPSAEPAPQKVDEIIIPDRYVVLLAVTMVLAVAAPIVAWFSARSRRNDA